MKIYHSTAEFRPEKGKEYVVTIGTFDGVHVGHRRILENIREIAVTHSAEVLLLTFFPHPRMVLKGSSPPLQMINSMEEKQFLLEDQGVDHLVIQPFNNEFSSLSAREFVSKILRDQLKTSYLVIGHDHHFGKNREGSFDLLQKMSGEMDYNLIQIPQELVKNVGVSSTRIRTAIKAGAIAEANQLLGSSFMISGKVVEGDKLGRKLGFPTANVIVKENYKIIPANGVYAVRVSLPETTGGEYHGMLNIGNRPTVDGQDRRIEVNIFDFQGNLYGCQLRLFLEKRIRDEKRFDSLEQLKDGISADEKEIRELFSR